MLTVKPTAEMLAEWKRIFEAHHAAMKPNRKTGTEVDQYFRNKYAHQVFNDAAFQEIVALNITENAFSRNKLPKGVLPNIKSYKTGTKSDATRGCGVHIHIGAKGHTPQTMRNLANIMASHESLIAEALDLDRGRMRRYCRTVDPRFLEQVNKKKPKTMSKLADIWYGSQDCSYGRNQHYNASGAERAYRRAVDKAFRRWLILEKKIIRRFLPKSANCRTNRSCHQQQMQNRPQQPLKK